MKKLIKDVKGDIKFMKPVLVAYRFGCFGNDNYSSKEYRDSIQFIVDKYFKDEVSQERPKNVVDPQFLPIHEDKMNLVTNNNYIEVCFYRRDNDNSEFDRASLIVKAKDFFTDISRNSGARFTRLAFNVNFCYNKLDESLIAKISKAMANSFDYLVGDDYRNEEWNTRRCDVNVIKLNQRDENVNNIVMVSRTRLAQTNKPVITFDLDINTTHLNMLERFAEIEITNFIDYAEGTINNIEKAIIDRIEGVLNENRE